MRYLVRAQIGREDWHVRVEAKALGHAADKGLRSILAKRETTGKPMPVSIELEITNLTEGGFA